MKWNQIKSILQDRWNSIKPKVFDLWNKGKEIAKNPLIHAAWTGAKTLVPGLNAVEGGLEVADKFVEKYLAPSKPAELPPPPESDNPFE